MSAPSPETSMQAPQREFALQRYTKYLTYASKNRNFSKKCARACICDFFFVILRPILVNGLFPVAVFPLNGNT